MSRRACLGFADLMNGRGSRLGRLLWLGRFGRGGRLGNRLNPFGRRRWGCGCFDAKLRHRRLDDHGLLRRNFLGDFGLGDERFLFGGLGRLRPQGLDEARRGQGRRDRLRRLRLLDSARLLGLVDGRVGEHVAAGQRNSPLPCHPLDELPGHDLFDGARRALHLDPVIAFEESDDFLAGRT
jgi:hypothetical protein